MGSRFTTVGSHRVRTAEMKNVQRIERLQGGKCRMHFGEFAHNIHYVMDVDVEAAEAERIVEEALKG